MTLFRRHSALNAKSETYSRSGGYHPADDIDVRVSSLLKGRTADIDLTGRLGQMFRERIWPRASKTIRAWMTWVIVLYIIAITVYGLFLPINQAIGFAAVSFSIIPASLMVIVLYAAPRSAVIEGVGLIVGLAVIFLCVSLMGLYLGGEFYERHLNIMLSIALTAIIMFPVPLYQTVIIALLAISLYLGLQMHNPNVDTVGAFAGALFFCSGIATTVFARRSMSLLDQKSFLLEYRDRRQMQELADANQRLERLSVTDPLTGIANRRHIHGLLEGSWQEADLPAMANTVALMCDVDDFKKLNDSLGHAEGDRCLVKIAGIIQSSLRDERDIVARYGGEEFLVYLPGASEDEGAMIAEQIRSRVANASLPNPASSIGQNVTISIGVASGDKVEKYASYTALIDLADAALYRAKRNGRDRVNVYEAA